jgi:hypothetical protein
VKPLAEFLCDGQVVRFRQGRVGGSRQRGRRRLRDARWNRLRDFLCA